MQLVGATQGFIRKPFVLRGIVQGILSALIALLLLTGIMATLQQNIPELILITSNKLMLILYASVLVLGVLVSGFSTLFAVSKYLNMKHDKLYG
jgi:cell division transport system permease protein